MDMIYFGSALKGCYLHCSDVDLSWYAEYGMRCRLYPSFMKIVYS